MTPTEEKLLKRIELLEQQNANSDKALNAALKKLDELENVIPNGDGILKTALDIGVYDNLFDFHYNEETGEREKASRDKVHNNFRNLYRNVMMSCGYHRRKLTKGKYYAVCCALKDISDDEYEDFRELIRTITTCIYAYKKNHGKE